LLGPSPVHLPRIAELSLTSDTDAIETWGKKRAFDISPTCLLWLFSGSNAFLEILSLSQFRQVTNLPAAATLGFIMSSLRLLSGMWWDKRNPPVDPKKLSFKGKTDLVTRANSGFGHETAVTFAALSTSTKIAA
jgi:hypothetical protein